MSDDARRIVRETCERLFGHVYGRDAPDCVFGPRVGNAYPYLLCDCLQDVDPVDTARGRAS
jgi:hypothetical protein